MRKTIFWVALACALALLCPRARAASEELEALMAEFRARYELDESSFALSYCDTVTGEEYNYNETAFMVAASTYKLPLNLYYYELEAAGELSPDTPVTEACTLAEAHMQSLLWSNNEVSHALIYRLGSFTAYKQAMRRFFTMADEEISPLYYEDNYYCTRMMLDTLRVLWQKQEQFSEALDYLTQAMPEAYFRRGVPDLPVAHKYGSFEGAENDVGIIWAAHPFLLAVYTASEKYYGEEICAQAAALLRAYTDRQARLEAHAQDVRPAHTAQRPEQAEAPEASPAPAAEEVCSPDARETAAEAAVLRAAAMRITERMGKDTAPGRTWLLPAAAAALGLTLLRLRRRKRS